MFPIRLGQRAQRRTPHRLGDAAVAGDDLQIAHVQLVEQSQGDRHRRARVADQI